MPSFCAAPRAFSMSREAIASTRDSAPNCIAGITFSTPILATPSTPQETFLVIDKLLPSLSTPFFRYAGEGRSCVSLNRRRQARASLALEHPAGIFRRQRACLVERGDFIRCEGYLYRRQIVVELRDRLGADDDAHHAGALQQPGK